MYAGSATFGVLALDSPGRTGTRLKGRWSPVAVRCEEWRTVEDASILDQINSLVAEEHELRGGSPSPERTERLRHVEGQLDQCWDLLRQRQARAEFGQNPDEAAVRSEHNVESYLQ